MNPSLRIAVADDEPDMRDYFLKILPRLGHRVVAVAATGEDLLAQCRAACPEALDVPFMLRLAGMRLKGATAEAPRAPVPADPGWASRVKAFARMTLTDEEQARWL